MEETKERKQLPSAMSSAHDIIPTSLQAHLEAASQSLCQQLWERDFDIKRISPAYAHNTMLLQARLEDERTHRSQAEHDAAEEARHAARLAAQRESSQGVQLALARQVQPLRPCVYSSHC